MSSLDSSPILTDVNDHLAVVRFNRPTQRNPLSVDILQNLETITAELLSRPDVDAVIFTGTDDVFASGANIRELAQLNAEAASHFSQLGQRLFQTIADATQVTIAAINGYCMGGALDLALACDIRVASRSAVFAHPGAQLGIITGWGGTQRLPRVIGRTRALEFFVTAKRYSSTEALEMGLVTRVGDPVIDCAIDCAQAARAVVKSY